MIKLVKPYVKFDEVSSGLKAILDSGTLTLGDNVESLRIEISKYVGSKYCFLTTSATTALSICIKLLNIGPGDEVLVSDFSFPASANVVEDVGASSVLVDVHKDTFNLDIEDAEKKCSKRTKAIVLVDALGNPSGANLVRSWAKGRGIFVIEDAACAFGSALSNRVVGSQSDFTCFSFHPRKLLTSGEGGAITLNNDQWADWLQIKLSHGGVRRSNRFEFVDFGFNYRLTEIQSYLLREQIKKIEQIVDRRIELWSRYKTELMPLGYLPQRIDSDVRFNVQSATFVVPNGTNRDQLITYLKDNDIESTIGTYSISSTEYYSKKYSSVQKNSKWLFENTITLPCHDDVPLEYVIEKIRMFS